MSCSIECRLRFFVLVIGCGMTVSTAFWTESHLRESESHQQADFRRDRYLRFDLQSWVHKHYNLACLWSGCARARVLA